MLEKADVKCLDKVVIRFSGDSGDGMQLAGNIFTNVSAPGIHISRLSGRNPRSARIIERRIRIPSECRCGRPHTRRQGGRARSNEPCRP